jgi:hypothetical protein
MAATFMPNATYRTANVIMKGPSRLVVLATAALGHPAGIAPAQLVNAAVPGRAEVLSGGIARVVAIASHLVTQLNDTTLVGIDLSKMKSDVSIDAIEEWDSLADQDRQDRIAHLVRQSQTKTVSGDYTTTNKPNTPEPGSQTVVHQAREIA